LAVEDTEDKRDLELAPLTPPIPNPGAEDEVRCPGVQTSVTAKMAQFVKRGVMGNLSHYFRAHGHTVVRHPVKVILASVLCLAVAGIGLVRFREESEMTALWVPHDSDFRHRFNFVQEHFPLQQRFHHVILEAENVLTGRVLRRMRDLVTQVNAIQTRSHKTWQDVCFRVPVVGKPECRQDSSEPVQQEQQQDQDEADEEDWFDDEDWGEPPATKSAFAGCDPAKMNLSISSIGDIGKLVNLLGQETFSIEQAVNMSREFYPEPYCTAVKHAPTACLSESILELWEEDVDVGELTDYEILDTINNKNLSTVFMREKNFTTMLSGIRYDNATGQIVGARVATISWITQINFTEMEISGQAMRGDLVDRLSFEFEGEMMKVVTNRSDLGNITLYANVHRMFFESLEGQAFKDARMLLLGYLTVFIYIIIMLGSISCVDMKFYPSLAGIVGVAMGIIASYGICSYLGFFYSAAHTVLPFLLLGIGIDDMFVIVQSLSTLSASEQNLDMEERLSAALSHAGVAITITSVTDFIAFGVGATTSLPALRSFCMYAGVGILVIFIVQVTWFTAILSLDERRREQRRNALLVCIKHPVSPASSPLSSASNASSAKQSILARCFEKLSTILMRPAMKVVVLVSTLGILGCGIFGIVNLKMEFKPEWLMDPHSEIHGWWFTYKEYFPSNGETGYIYFVSVDYEASWARQERLLQRLEASKDNIASIDPWQLQFKKYVEETESVDWDNIEENFFRSKLSQFLFSPPGAKYRLNFKFADELKCGQPAPRILVSTVQYQHVLFNEASYWVPAMEGLKQIVMEANITGVHLHHGAEMAADSVVSEAGDVFPMSTRYANWETDKVIGRELYQNLGSSALAIFITVLLFLGSARGAVIVICCVLATIVNVAGFMHFWGLTIDVISCNSLVISIGLCVDFSVHIIHGFLTATGDRNSRVAGTLCKTGPAVFNGGLSTLLAFILLATSSTYVFLSFFKIFFLICVFGLYHGLIALPVILSLVGPSNR